MILVGLVQSVFGRVGLGDNLGEDVHANDEDNAVVDNKPIAPDMFQIAQLPLFALIFLLPAQGLANNALTFSRILF